LGLYEKQDTIPFDEDRFTQGLTEEDKNLGITIRSSTNGSMTKLLFLDAVLHYIKNLPSDQGADGKYAFLLLDSHVSGWNP
jgi:glutamine cyclotransferase